MKHPTFSLLRKVLIHSRKYWLHIVGIFLLNLLSTPLALLTPIPLKIVIDSAFANHPIPPAIAFFFPAGFQFSFTQIILVAAVMLVLIELISQIVGIVSWLLHAYTGEKLVLSFRTLLFNHAQRLSLTYHDKTGVADSIYRVQNDANAIRNLVVAGLSPLVTSVITLLGMLFIMTAIDWHFTIIALAIIPPLIILTNFSRRKLSDQWSNVKKEESAAMAVVHETLSALRVVKAFVREEFEEQRFIGKSEKAVKSQLKVARTSGLFDLATGLILAIATAAFLYMGSIYVQQGKLSLGDLILIMAYLAQFLGPLRTISKQFANLQSSIVGLERVYFLIDKEKDVKDNPHAKKIKQVAGAVKFENVSFSYQDGSTVLKNISFEIEPGQRIGIMGSTGSGKTTLVNLLARFYEPTAGRILVDGMDIRDIKLRDYRSQFGIVLQEPVLFSLSIEENIAFGKPDAGKKEIQKAAQDAFAHDFIIKLPEQYMSKVGERGMQLSGGERQRISIARAFLKNSPILILDEPTSSVDIRTEALIMEATRKLMENRTSFLITHRLDTLSQCDIVIHLEKGEIIEIINNKNPGDLKNKFISYKQETF